MEIEKQTEYYYQNHILINYSELLVVVLEMLKLLLQAIKTQMINLNISNNLFKHMYLLFMHFAELFKQKQRNWPVELIEASPDLYVQL